MVGIYFHRKIVLGINAAYANPYRKFKHSIILAWDQHS